MQPACVGQAPRAAESGYDRRADEPRPRVDRVTSTSLTLLRLATIAAVALGATSLAACGRKGDPERPSATTPKGDRPVGIPIGPTAPERKPVKVDKKPFLLDPLL